MRWLVGDEGDFAKDIPGGERGDDLVVLHDLDFTIGDGVELVAEVPGVEDRLTGMEVLGDDVVRTEDPDLGDIPRQDEVQQPVESDPTLRSKPGILERYTARQNIQAGIPRRAGSRTLSGTADPLAQRRASLPRPVKRNGFFLAERIVARMFVAAGPRLADRVLGGRRRDDAVLLRDRGAVAQGPDSRVFGDFEELVDLDPAGVARAGGSRSRGTVRRGPSSRQSGSRSAPAPCSPWPGRGRSRPRLP